MRKRRSSLVPVLLGVLFTLGGREPDAAQEDPPTPEETGAAIYALKVELELERAHLEKSLSDYFTTEARRAELRDQISVLYARIGNLVRESDPSTEGASLLDSLEAEILSAEQAEQAIRGSLLRLRERIAASRERIRFFERKIAEMKRSQPAEAENLGGTWDVTFLPSGDRGVFSLKQSGTLISGEYQQEGGWKGSLQGTLVNNKLVLHRIDSKLGPAADLEGSVSGDLKSVKGTWQSLVLSDGSAASGAWTAKKREKSKKSDGGSP